MTALRRVLIAFAVVAACLGPVAPASARFHEKFFGPEPDPSLNGGVESLELAPVLKGPALAGRNIAYAPTPSGAVWLAANRPDCEDLTSGCGFSSSLSRLSSKGRLVTAIGDAGAIDLSDRAGAESVVVSDAEGRAVTLSYEGGDQVTARRFLADGAPDSSFGSGGAKITFDCGCRAELAPRMAIQVDAEGRILAAFTTAVAGQAQPALTLAKLFPDGSFDRGFGQGGYLRSTYTSEGPFTAPGGAIFLFHRGPIGEAPRTVERFTRQGVPDQGFDRGADRAIARLERSRNLRSSQVSTVRFRPRGTVDLFFTTYPSTTVLRLRFDGSVESGFGKVGEKVIPKVVLQTLPLPGEATLALTTSKSHPGVELTRFLAGYKLDPHFGREGSAWPGGVYEEEGVAMTLASKGRVTMIDEGHGFCRSICVPQPLLLRWRIEAAVR
jgi:hypothetical protein